MTSCPQCEQPGRPIAWATVAFHWAKTVFKPGWNALDWAYCNLSHCPTMYFTACGEVSVPTQELRVAPFHKAQADDRLICFCFQYTTIDVLADHRGGKDAPARTAIANACARGEADCALKNPTGRCCLGQISRWLKNRTRAGMGPRPESTDCCSLAHSECD